MKLPFTKNPYDALAHAQDKLAATENNIVATEAKLAELNAGDDFDLAEAKNLRKQIADANFDAASLRGRIPILRCRVREADLAKAQQQKDAGTTVMRKRWDRVIEAAKKFRATGKQYSADFHALMSAIADVRSDLPEGVSNIALLNRFDLSTIEEFDVCRAAAENEFDVVAVAHARADEQIDLLNSMALELPDELEAT